jgi:hypothetical protein
MSRVNGPPLRANDTLDTTRAVVPSIVEIKRFLD